MHIQRLRKVVVSTLCTVSTALLAAMLASVPLASAQLLDRVEFVNAIPGTTLSLRIDGQVAEASLPYGARVLVDTNNASLGIWEAVDTATNTPLAADDGFLPESGSWTLVAHQDVNGNGVVTYLPNAVDPTGEENSRVAIYHMAKGSDRFAVSIDGRTVTPAGGLVPGASVITTVTPGSREMTVVNLDKNIALSPPSLLDLEAQTVTNTYITMPSGDIDVVQTTAPVELSGPAALGYCNGQPVTVSLERGGTPTDGPDVILGTTGDDAIAAGAGDDIICGRGGDDVIFGQDGNDYIDGGPGRDKLRGGKGDDELWGGFGRDDLNGGRDNDLVRGGEGNDTAVRGGTGDDFVDGGPGDDELVNGNGGYDVVMGGAGNDALVSGGPRPDQIFGGPGDDVVRGLGGADKIFGGAGDDELLGGKQPDFIDGGNGIDSCNGGSENDRARCESRNPNIESVVPAAIDSASATQVPCTGSSAVAGSTCWVVTVPEDFTNPTNGRTVDLYTVYVDNGDPNNRGPVLRLGGEAGSYDASLSVAAFAGQKTDLLTIDLRGTGRSTPSLDCPEVSDRYYDLKALTYRAAQRAIREAEGECLARLRGAGINIDAFTTTARVHDIEIVRELLDIDTINLWADNYGTRLAAALLRENPDPYRAVMFSNVLPVDVSQLAESEHNVDVALDRLFAACGADADCKGAYGDLNDRLDGVLAWLDITTQSATLTDLDGEEFEVLVDPDKYVYDYLATMLNTDTTIAMVPGAIDDAWGGDVMSLAEQIEAAPPATTLAIAEGASRAVTCADEAWVAAKDERCQGWFSGSGVVSDSSPAPWTQTTAIVTGRFDPVTPSGWASQVATMLPKVALGAFDGGGRRIVGECADGILAGVFTAYPAVPDVSCAADSSVEFDLQAPAQLGLRAGELDTAPERPIADLISVAEQMSSQAD